MKQVFLIDLSMMPKYILLLLVLTILSSCAPLSDQKVHDQLQAYIAKGNETLSVQHAPVFIVENSESEFNRLGTPTTKISPDGSEKIFIDNRSASLFVQKSTFQTAKGSYTNFIYRIHFEEIPFRFIPFYLGAGKNVGLLVIVTLDKSGDPILYTTVNTCGCYLAFVATSYMPDNAFPRTWPRKRQTVYSENLPAILDFHAHGPEGMKAMILLRDGTHRVKDIWLADLQSVKVYNPVHAEIRPLEYLEKLPLVEKKTTSFYEESGSGKGYVKGSTKIWERLFMGWWAFDWRVGEDKRLGKDINDPPVFYTSLKPWARAESDMRNFEVFLAYWGWNL